jgi:hypothetical protein
MVRRAARLINENIRTVCPIAAGFFAYSIDAEMEGAGDAEILLECGASPAQLKLWKSLNWL